MPVVVGILILTLAVLLQSTILSQIMLLRAPADLVLVTVISWIMQERVKAIWEWAIIGGILVGFVSEMPMWVPVTGYLMIAAVGSALKRRVWRAPVIALFTTVFIGTLVFQILVFVVLRVIGTVIDPLQAFNLVVLPSLLLNLLISLPVQGFTSEIASWLYPDEIEA